MREKCRKMRLETQMETQMETQKYKKKTLNFARIYYKMYGKSTVFFNFFAYYLPLNLFITLYMIL